MNVAATVTKPIQIPLRISLLCPICSDVQPVSEVQHSLLDLPRAVLSCGHTRGAALPKGEGLIGLEDLAETENPDSVNEELSALCFKLFPHDDAFPIEWASKVNQQFDWTRSSRVQYWKKKHAKEAELKAQADAMLGEAGHGDLIAPEFDDKDEDDIPDYSDGYAFGARQDDTEGTRFEGCRIVREPSTMWDPIDTFEVED